MKKFSLVAAVLALGLTMTAGDADAARRLGGGKSAGMQRQMTPPKAPAAAPAPARNAAGAAPTQPKRSWMGPLAGLAAGLGLAALASHLGFGEELASMLLIGLAVLAVVVVVGMIARRRAVGQQPAMAGAGATRYSAGAPAGVDGQSANRSYDMLRPAGGTAAAGAAAAVEAGSGGNIPADFDVPAFVRNAKVHFIRLQAANDAGNLDDIREFTTPEMFAEIKMDISERGGATQETDVVSIEADVLDVAEEANRYVVSVRFTGLVREDANAAAEPVDEVWHLVKPREGSGGWLLAGIQQMQ